MTSRPVLDRLPPPVLALLRSPRLSSGLAVTGVGVATFSFLIRALAGWPGLIAMLAGLIALCVAALIAQWDTLEHRRIIPVSLLVFLGWAGLSLIWSQYTWATLGSLAYLLAFTLLGMHLALMRDTIQVVRTFGDVLRVALGASIAIEILSGLLIDTPITFLAVQGNLAQLGPIQGVLGTRNQLGLIAVIAVVTFAIELRTRSVSRLLAVLSLIAGGAVLLLTRSPVVIGTAAVVAVSMVILFGIRRVAEERRTAVQFVVLAAALVTAIVAWILRSPIVAAMNASGELTYRLELWRAVGALVPLHAIEGWGWIGQWRPGLSPFVIFDGISERNELSAGNAFVDLVFQLGIPGLLIFTGMLGLAFVRSWLLAGRRRSVVFAWPALVLATLIVISLAESSILIEFGWMTFVICCVKASQHLSWRQALARVDDGATDRATR